MLPRYEAHSQREPFNFKDFEFGHTKVKGHAALRKQIMFNSAYVANSGPDYRKMSHKLTG